MDDLEQADGVALALAHVRGDEQAVNAMLAMYGIDLFAVTVGVLIKVLADAGIGATQLEAALADWQARRRETL